MAEVENLIGGSLAKVLEAGRPRYNALFAQARRAMPALDPGAFAAHFRNVITPIAAEVARVAPERLGEVVDVLYEFSLELVGKDFAARYPAVLQGWHVLLAGLPHYLAAAPRLFAGSVTNALYTLSITPGGRPLDWVASMRSLGAIRTDVPTLLEAGKVCAWRAGLAHYRDGALATCGRLTPAVASAALGLPTTLDQLALTALLARLQADPWLSAVAAARPTPDKKDFRIVARIGGFRGFGGPFLAPPTVMSVQDRLYVQDGESCWLLSADCYGATLHRQASAPPASTSAATVQMVNGVVQYGKHHVPCAEMHQLSSSGATTTTLALTTPLTHMVYLLAVAVYLLAVAEPGDGSPA